MRRVASPSPGLRRGRRARHAGRALLVAATLMTIAPPARGGTMPNWQLDLRVARWVAPSSFAATVVRQSSGLKVRMGLPVTLVLDRRTACSRTIAGGKATWVPCKPLRARIAARPSLLVAAGGQFETGHLGRIGFRARSLLVRS